VSDQGGNLPADAEDPGYKQLGDDGNPFTGDASEQGTQTEQPGIDPATDDEEDRAAHHD
jgi:hypothetical protein